MAKYNYSKYSVIDTRIYKEQSTWTDIGQIGAYNSNIQGRLENIQYRPGYSFDSRTGLFSPVAGFTWGRMNAGEFYYCGSAPDYYSYWQGPPERKITRFTIRWVWPDSNNIGRVFGETNTATLLSGEITKGNFVNKLVAEDGLYPNDGYNSSDGYWYVKETQVVSINILSAKPTHLHNQISLLTLKTSYPRRRSV